MKTLLLLTERQTSGVLAAELVDDETGDAAAVTSWTVESKWVDPFGVPYGWTATFLEGDRTLLTARQHEVQIERISSG